MYEHTKFLLNFDENFKDISNEVKEENILVENVELKSDIVKFGKNSAYFNGTNSSITIPSSVLPNFQQDWTIDWWEYRTTVNTASCILNATSGNFNDDRGILIGYAGNTTSLQFYCTDNASGWYIASAMNMGNIPLNQWVHRAVVKNGYNYYTFQNGVLQGQISSTRIIMSVSTIRIGNYANGLKYYKGYIDSFRISDIGRWTENFVVPTEEEYKGRMPLFLKKDGKWIRGNKIFIKEENNWKEIKKEEINNVINSEIKVKPKYVWKKYEEKPDDNTLLLLHFDSNIMDFSLYNQVLKNNSITSYDDSTPFTSGKSIKFSGNQTDYIYFIDNSFLNFKKNDFTIDYWVNPATMSDSCILTFGDGPTSTLFLIYYSNNNVYLYFGSSIVSILIDSFSEVNTWEHIALVRKNNMLYYFRNGKLKWNREFTENAPDPTGYTSVIGGRSGYSQGFKGKIDEFRVSNIARWDAEFIPPNKEYNVNSFIEYVYSEDPNKYPNNNFGYDGYYYKKI